MQIAPADEREVCDKAIYEEKELFIVADIGAAVDVSASAYTDAKLLRLIIKRRLINCGKFCPDRQIQFALERRPALLG